MSTEVSDHVRAITAAEMFPSAPWTPSWSSARYLFPIPDEVRGHCVPVSLAHMKRAPSMEFARNIAERASAIARVPMDYEMLDSWLGHRVDRLFDPNDGGGYAMRPDDIAKWLELSGLRLIERTDYPNSVAAPLPEEFARTHREGNWVIAITGHMLALRAGELYAYDSNMHNWPVRVAYRVEEIAP